MSKTTKNKIVYEENINNIAGKASAIVFPESIQEIKQLVRSSTEDIIARGGGSSFTGAVLPKDSVIIDFSKMNKILEISPSKKIARVEPGVLLSELNDELEFYGLEFPIEPLFQGIETIGGLIAKNSSRNREIKYGRIINWIENLEVINQNGEQIKISKSDLSDFVGMEGTTGIIISACLRVSSKKERSLSILKALSLKDIFIANKKLRFDPEICSIDLISREISSLLGLENKYHLFVEFDSLKGSFKAEEYRKYIRLKNRAYKKAAMEGYYYMSNAKLLVDYLEDFVLFLEERHIPYFAHIASGVIYPLFRQEQVDKIQETSTFAKKLRGRVAYNFGIGLTKKDCLELGEVDLIKRVKLRHDPQNKFNRDKLIDAKLLARAGASRLELSAPNPGEIKSEEKIIGEVTKYNENSESKQKENVSVPEIPTLKRPDSEISPEEKEKIRKIAFGFFGAKKGDNPPEENK